MNFLELVQMATRESGTVSGVTPTTVVGQTGRLLKFVEWVQSAWLRVQNSRNSWRWMEAEFAGSLSIGAGRYTAASFSLARWADWVTRPETLSLYKTSIGVSDEGPIPFLDFDVWRRTYERGAQVQNRPTEYSVSPAGELCFGPTPDVVYSVRGDYRKSPQTLVNNADIPELPPRFHEVIAWYALILMAEHDEAEISIATASRNYRVQMGDLERDQLPRLGTVAGALA